jgi:hypothetical protein
MLIGLEIRKHSRLFEFGDMHVLSFIDYQSHALVVGIFPNNEIRKRPKSIDLLGPAGFEVKSKQNELPQIAKGIMSIRDQADRHIRVQLIEQVTNQGCLTAANLSRDDPETRSIHQSILEQRQSGFVLLAELEKSRVW